MIDKAEHIFDTDLEMTQKEDRVFEVNLSDRWSIYTTPNGGYIMAVIAKAMGMVSDKNMTPIITASYIARCRPGKALIHVELVSDSGSFTRLMARLVQNGEEKIRAMGTFSSGVNGNAKAEYDSNPPEIAPIESAVQAPPMGVHSLLDQIDLYLDPSCVGWFLNEYSKPMQFKGWICFKDKRKLDVPSILLFADSFPPPVFVAHGPKNWVPTIELSVNIRKVPDTHILKGIFKSRFISNGLVEEDGELWDAKGNLIALSRQYSLFSNT